MNCCSYNIAYFKWIYPLLLLFLFSFIYSSFSELKDSFGEAKLVLKWDVDYCLTIFSVLLELIIFRNPWEVTSYLLLFWGDYS